jgi:hypothetical protein
LASGTIPYTCDRCTTTNGSATGVLKSWILPTLTLKAGINIITVTGTTPGGASGADTITVTYAPTFPGNSLVLAMPFEEGSGTSAADLSGNANNGTLINSPTWAGASSGRYGNSLSFNGTTQWLSVADSSSLDLTQSLTISVWVKPAAVSTTYQSILAKSGLSYRLFASVEGECGSGGVSGFTRSNGASGPQDQACYATPLPIGAWTHVVLTYDGANIKLYTGGVLRATQSHTGYMEPSAGVLYIANSEFSEYFQGALDELRVYNWAIPLTAGGNTIGGACNQTASVATPSIAGDMNCPIVPLAPPITFKVGAATNLKIGSGSSLRIGSVPQ